MYAELPWRRRDPLAVDPVVLVTGPSGAVVAKATVLAASSEAALISFAADAAGHYHVYWLPHNRQLTGGTCENAYLSTRGRPSRGAPGRTGFSAKSKGRGRGRGLPTPASPQALAAWTGGAGLRTFGVVAGDVRRFAPAQRRRRLLESNASGAALPWARLLSMQSRGVRYRRHAGELIASVAERDAMHAAHAGADDGGPPLLFAHAVSSVMSVTRTDTGVPAGGADGLPRPAAADGGVVPLCWARAGPTSSVSLRAAPGQHALLQVGLLAGARAVRVTGATLATLRTSDGVALAAACRRLPALFARRLVASRHQLHAYGRRRAAHERVAPLRAAAACRAAARRRRLHRRAHAAPRQPRSSAHRPTHRPRIRRRAAAAATTSLQSAMPAAVPPFRPLGALGLAVDAAAVTAPYDELGSLARIAWVNSRAGIHERPPPGVAPIAAQTGGGELDKAPEVHFAFERSLAVGALGLPEQITVKGAELLAAPISVRAQVEKVQVEWRASRPVALANGTAAGVRWEAEGWARRSGPQTPPLSWRCTARAEYDGWVDLTVEIRAKSGEVQLQDVELRVPFRQQMSTYGLGMGFRGGRRPARWAWSVGRAAPRQAQVPAR